MPRPGLRFVYPVSAKFSATGGMGNADISNAEYSANRRPGIQELIPADSWLETWRMFALFGTRKPSLNLVLSKSGLS
ncbi:hypothetical protein AJ78_06559 [Emergomyces pasteurianus Ep9510]|uniref:Uncharacterized protein n=1 Tax=Emergomyces pasteurianus Ep9510 TaxID=1447872 RepID=A0A1J9PAD6_9EURO|nr:hypothetical protein AJ78_06559 [Emergomyces pasteurianus Ep9510]